VAVWRSWSWRWSDQRSYSTPSHWNGWPYRGATPGVGNLSQSSQTPRSTQPGHASVHWVTAKGWWCSAAGRKRQIWCCLQVTLCDPYLSTLEAFAHRLAIQIHVYFTLLVSFSPQLTAKLLSLSTLQNETAVKLGLYRSPALAQVGIRHTFPNSTEIKLQWKFQPSGVHWFAIRNPAKSSSSRIWKKQNLVQPWQWWQLPVQSVQTAQAETSSWAGVLLASDPSSWPEWAAVHRPACHSASATHTPTVLQWQAQHISCSSRYVSK